MRWRSHERWLEGLLLKSSLHDARVRSVSPSTLHLSISMWSRLGAEPLWDQIGPWPSITTQKLGFMPDKISKWQPM